MPAPEADRADGSLRCVAQPIKVAWPFGRGMWRSSNIVARPGNYGRLVPRIRDPQLLTRTGLEAGHRRNVSARISTTADQPTGPGTQKPALRGERAFVADGRSVSRPAPSTEPILPAGPRLWQGGRGGAFRG